MAQKKSLIAAVALAAIVEGKRVLIAPGEEVPPLPEHDERELLAAGAIVDPEAEAREERAAERDSRREQAEFDAARKRVQDEQASVNPAAAKGKAK